MSMIATAGVAAGSALLFGAATRYAYSRGERAEPGRPGVGLPLLGLAAGGLSTILAFGATSSPPTAIALAALGAGLLGASAGTIASIGPDLGTRSGDFLRAWNEAERPYRT